MWELERNRNIKSEAKEGRKNRLDKETRHQYNQKRGTKRKREFIRVFPTTAATVEAAPVPMNHHYVYRRRILQIHAHAIAWNVSTGCCCHLLTLFLSLSLCSCRSPITSVVAIFAHIHNHVEYFSNFNILCAFRPNNNNNNIAFKWCNDDADCHRNTENAIFIKMNHTERTK